MAVSYKKLWKLLIDKDMKKVTLNGKLISPIMPSASYHKAKMFPPRF